MIVPTLLVTHVPVRIPNLGLFGSTVDLNAPRCKKVTLTVDKALGVIVQSGGHSLLIPWSNISRLDFETKLCTTCNKPLPYGTRKATCEDCS